MGYIVHHTITVTSGCAPQLLAAHAFAVATGASVSPITETKVNGYASFLVAPDGSKEGWEESAAGDGRRAAIKAWLRAQSFGALLDWFEVAQPEDRAPYIVEHSYED